MRLSYAKFNITQFHVHLLFGKLHRLASQYAFDQVSREASLRPTVKPRYNILYDRNSLVQLNNLL